MRRKLMWVEWDDDARLSRSRKKPGAFSPLTRDSDDRLGHVTLSDADEDDHEPSSSWPPGPDPDSEWDQEKFEQQVEAVATVLTLLAEGVVWVAPHIRQWWSDSAKPAIKSTGRKVKTTLSRAPVLRRTTDANAVPVPGRPRSGSERAEVEGTGPEMSSAEAQQRFARAVVAAAYADEQMRLLRNARITDDDDPLELASKMQELTPERLQAAIRLLLQAEPTMLDHDNLAAFEKTLAAGELASIRRVRELPSPPRTRD
jgi:hypothetical protein